MSLLPTLPSLPLLPQVALAPSTPNVDTLGNVFDAAGNQTGVLKGSQADVGASGYQVTPTGSTPSTSTPIAAAAATNFNTGAGAGSDLTSIPSDAPSALSQGKAAVNAVLHPIDSLTTMLYTSRFIFLWVGFILVVAGLFQFRQTQQVIQGAVNTAKKGAKIYAGV